MMSLDDALNQLVISNLRQKPWSCEDKQRFRHLRDCGGVETRLKYGIKVIQMHFCY